MRETTYCLPGREDLEYVLRVSGRNVRVLGKVQRDLGCGVFVNNLHVSEVSDLEKQTVLRIRKEARDLRTQGFEDLEFLSASFLGKTAYSANHNHYEGCVVEIMERHRSTYLDEVSEALKRTSKLSCCPSVYHVGLDEKLVSVREFVNGKTLFQAVQEQAVISRDELIATAYFLLDAIERMNDVGVLHRDVKPENLLVNNSVKPFDFETAVIGQRRGSELVREFPGTTRIVSSLRTTSPEVLQSARIYNDLSEAWSTGMCLYYLAYGVYPFLATNSPMIQHLRITQDKFEYPEKANVPKGLLRVIKSLLNPDKDSRANIKKARKKVGRLL